MSAGNGCGGAYIFCRGRFPKGNDVKNYPISWSQAILFFIVNLFNDTSSWLIFHKFCVTLPKTEPQLNQANARFLSIKACDFDAEEARVNRTINRFKLSAIYTVKLQLKWFCYIVKTTPLLAVFSHLHTRSINLFLVTQFAGHLQLPTRQNIIMPIRPSHIDSLSPILSSVKSCNYLLLRLLFGPNSSIHYITTTFINWNPNHII